MIPVYSYFTAPHRQLPLTILEVMSSGNSGERLECKRGKEGEGKRKQLRRLSRGLKVENDKEGLHIRIMMSRMKDSAGSKDAGQRSRPLKPPLDRERGQSSRYQA